MPQMQIKMNKLQDIKILNVSFAEHNSNSSTLFKWLRPKYYNEFTTFVKDIFSEKPQNIFVKINWTIQFSLSKRTLLNCNCSNEVNWHLLFFCRKQDYVTLFKTDSTFYNTDKNCSKRHF